MKDMLRWVVSVAVTLLAYGAAGNTNSWTSIGPDGGRVFKIAYNPSDPSIVYLLSQGGFSRSTDGGVTWKLVYTDFQEPPIDMAVDPTNPNNVYVVAQVAPNFLASSDGGKTMAPVTRPPIPTWSGGNWSVQVAADGKTVYVASGPYITASADRGKSWSLKTGVSSSQFMNNLYADPKDPLTLYAAVAQYPGYGLYVTHDGALTWNVSNWSSTDEYNYTMDLSIDPSNTNNLWNARGNGLWVSHDRGLNWTLTSYGISAFQNVSRQSSAVAVAPHNSSIIYVSDAWGDTVRSKDGGASWSDVTGNIDNQGTNVIAINPTNDANVLIGGIGGVWGTTTAGTHWTEQVEGLTATYVEHFSANPDTDRIYMNTEDSLIGYVANGAARAQLTNRDNLRSYFPAVGSFVVSSISSQTGANGYLFAAVPGGVASSPDGGQTWSMHQQPYYGGTMMQIMATWPGSHSLLAAGIAAQFRSDDDGLNWTPVTAGLPANAQFNKLVTAPSDSKVAYVSAYGSLVLGPTPYYDLFKSVDAGLSWARAGSDWPSMIYQIAVDPLDAQTIYVTTETRFLKSTTGGKSFTDMPLNSSVQGHIPSMVAIDPIHNQILYAMAGQRVMRSVDGGQNWQVLPGSPVSPTYGWSSTDMTVDPNRTSDVYVASMRNGAYKLTVSPDLALSSNSSGSQSASVLTRTYTVTNKGPYDATGAKLVVNLPAGSTKISGTADSGQCATTGLTLTCTIPIVRNGASYSANVTAAVAGGGDSLTKATLSADQPDSDSGNNAVSTTSTGTTSASTPDASAGPGTQTTGSGGTSGGGTGTAGSPGGTSSSAGAAGSTGGGTGGSASGTTGGSTSGSTGGSASGSTGGSVSGSTGGSVGGSAGGAATSSAGSGGSGGGGAFSVPSLMVLGVLLMFIKMLPLWKRPTALGAKARAAGGRRFLRLAADLVPQFNMNGQHSARNLLDDCSRLAPSAGPGAVQGSLKARMFRVR